MFIDQPEKILQMRQNLVLVQEKVPPDLARTFTNLERNGNPWGIAADKRMDWAEGHEVPTLDDKPDAEYLLWVGCAGAYDDRVKKQTVALVEIMKEAGVDFAVLGLEEGCSGDPARRSGNEMLYQMQAQQNVEAMNARKVKKVITACPHCLHTIKNEYPQLGGNFEVRHHTQLMRELVATGKVQIDATKTQGQSIVFHDPCYLGRWNGEYDAPRDVLDAVPAKSPRVELPRNRENAFCCGAGGGRMWMEEKIGTRVNHNRVDEVLASGADTVATACPFCTIMLTDGVNDRNAAEKVQVLNVSELVARSMKRKREIETDASAKSLKPDAICPSSDGRRGPAAPCCGHPVGHGCRDAHHRQPDQGSRRLGQGEPQHPGRASQVHHGRRDHRPGRARQRIGAWLCEAQPQEGGHRQPRGQGQDRSDRSQQLLESVRGKEHQGQRTLQHHGTERRAIALGGERAGQEPLPRHGRRHARVRPSSSR